ncbi:Sterol-sensing domain of SREBP cleavage-activation [Teratosphaeria destructans]|uniref:Sterol-sensing domain of SREBP cleavage-activation n=1 Tax=Teratosphaeria destructans TaxID=418781 RepID=A0A9W7SQZ7_9PEZI|nr:Sterol-sensing domain of SREBP cleavage-activation [Teratosphaeria destructans]
MLWYLLYPLRGTTNPPAFPANHPIRRAFYRHGKTTAQHWLVAMLVSVAIAAGFSYPTIFLSENPTAGFARYPHSVWTSARPFHGDESAVDVEMRQVWVHGSYMNALDKDVLKSGLTIQQALVGDEKLTQVFPTLNEKLRSSTLQWGYHSPLMYWNNSAVTIEQDEDIIRTVNDQSGTSSSLNVALRPASVFAGKKFDRKRLLAADALVLTLMNKASDNVGGKWTNRMKSISQGACGNCTLFPHDGNVTRNKVYEFSFVPLSISEHLALTFAYSCMALYVLFSLRRIKAFHSRFGLVVTAITQVTCSILSSFTICGILKINLSMIPQNAYPFVVLVIGLENMFRLINAVLQYPATTATDQRIANALGDIGPVSVATAFQNIAILSILARFVSPGVAAFCAFACIATLFDVFFLLTFFIAVLNVDIRRLELQDALSRSNLRERQRAKRKTSPARHAWLDALVQGRLPFSTRMAGTAVTTTFILSLNYHFFERHEKATTLRHLLGMARGGAPSLSDFDTFTPPPINASLTPGQWMRMQDFDTAREVMRLAKPGADTFIVRVFAPLIVVLEAADRTGAPLGAAAWALALRSFAIHHLYPVAVAVVFAVAFVAVLMNFLLYKEDNDGYTTDDERLEGDALKVQPVTLDHKLDIIKVAGTSKGHFATVGLDRSISVSKFDRTNGYAIFNVPREILGKLQWPIKNVSIDDSADWLAMHCANDQIVLYSCSTGSLAHRRISYPDDNPPVYFGNMRLNASYFVVLTSGGRIVMQSLESGDTIEHRLSHVPLLGANLLDNSVFAQPKLLVATEDSRIVDYNWDGSGWEMNCSQPLPVNSPDSRTSGTVRITAPDALGPDILIVEALNTITFLETQSLATLSKLELLDDCVIGGQALLGPVTQCPACNSLALMFVGIAQSHGIDAASTVTTFAVDVGQDMMALPICLRKGGPACKSFESCTQRSHNLDNAGAWDVASSTAILGLRRRQEPLNREYPLPSSGARMRNRRRAGRLAWTNGDNPDHWEAYRLSPDGTIDTVDACPVAGDETR